MGEVKKPNGSEENLPQPTYVLAPAYYPGYEDQDTVNLADYIHVLWRRRYLIVAGTLACALAAFVVSSLMTRVYEAKATLILMPPKFSTELKPAPLSVETYQSILESGYIASRLRTELIEKGIIGADEGIGSLETQIYPGKEKDQPYIPLIDLIVEAGDPEKAAAVANSWAETFINESGGLATKGQQGTLQFIRAEYPESKGRLAVAETKLKGTENSFQEKIRITENLWNSRLADFQAKWNIEALKKQLEAIQRELTESVGLLTTLHKIELEIKHTGDTLAELKKEIQAHPQFLILAKSISDDALWDKVGKDFSAETAEQLEALKLRTQELNPIYQSLAQRLADTQVAYDALVPQREALQRMIVERQEEAQELHQLILGKELELGPDEPRKGGSPGDTGARARLRGGRPEA
ncbi:MAG: Wzz/FepE/Etk N-terminal domain-containing protein [Acidobacteriota bacterium]